MLVIKGHQLAGAHRACFLMYASFSVVCHCLNIAGKRQQSDVTSTRVGD
jgi:hypothetical protein